MLPFGPRMVVSRTEASRCQQMQGLNIIVKRWRAYELEETEGEWKCAVKTYIFDTHSIDREENIEHFDGARRRWFARRIAKVDDLEHLVRGEDIYLETNAV